MSSNVLRIAVDISVYSQKISQTNEKIFRNVTRNKTNECHAYPRGPLNAQSSGTRSSLQPKPGARETSGRRARRRRRECSVPRLPPKSPIDRRSLLSARLVELGYITRPAVSACTKASRSVGDVMDRRAGAAQPFISEPSSLSPARAQVSPPRSPGDSRATTRAQECPRPSNTVFFCCPRRLDLSLSVALLPFRARLRYISS